MWLGDAKQVAKNSIKNNGQRIEPDKADKRHQFVHSYDVVVLVLIQFIEGLKLSVVNFQWYNQVCQLSLFS